MFEMDEEFDVMLPNLDLIVEAARIYADTFEANVPNNYKATEAYVIALAKARAFAGAMMFLKTELEESPNANEVPPNGSQDN